MRGGLFAAGLWAPGSAPPAPAVERRVLAPGARHGGLARPARRRERLRARPSRRPFAGRVVGTTEAADQRVDIAWAATLRAAAIRRRPAEASRALRLRTTDLLRRQRAVRPRGLWLLVVDGSGSMGGALTALAARMADAALADAYRRRAGVALIAFRAEGARLVCDATRKIDRAKHALAELAVGGTTPLGAGLRLARRWLSARLRRQPHWLPSLVVITDGRANVGAAPGHEGVLAELRREAHALGAMDVDASVLLDPTAPGDGDEAARRLARWLGAERVALRELGADVGARELLAAMRQRGRRRSGAWRNRR